MIFQNGSKFKNTDFSQICCSLPRFFPTSAPCGTYKSRSKLGAIEIRDISIIPCKMAHWKNVYSVSSDKNSHIRKIYTQLYIYNILHTVWHISWKLDGAAYYVLNTRQLEQKLTLTKTRTYKILHITWHINQKRRLTTNDVLPTKTHTYTKITGTTRLPPAVQSEFSWFYLLVQKQGQGGVQLCDQKAVLCMI